MAVVPIITIPNKTLTTETEPVTDFGEELKKTISNLRDTVRAAEDPEGAGLAATQIGISKSICIVRRFIVDKGHSGNSNIKEYMLINPKITKKSGEKEVAWEGCLSVPDTYVEVERAKKIKVEALDPDGKNININTSGFFARVIQHEVDHLNGILMTDHALGEKITEKEFDSMQAAL
ncbi:peptide deformylase [Patescibacteria group bacterium]